jgi:C4-dicarboxylate transporter
MWGTISALFDGSWVDIGTLIIALGYARLVCNRVAHQSFVSKATGLSFLHGLTIFPLLLLVGASISSFALTAVLNSNKIILAGAGLVALFSMLEYPDE